MDAEYPDRPERKGTWMDVMFMLMVFITGGFSGYTTYLGFSKDFPPLMSGAVTAIVFLGLVMLNFHIRGCRLRGDSLRGAAAAFLMVFVFSFASNTNALYSMFVEADIVRETQEEAWAVFDRESSKALDVIEGDAGYKAELAKFAKVENEITKLRTQITDPRNPGLGQKAQEHLRRIHELLETDVTDRVPPDPGAPMREHEAYAESLIAHIHELMEERRNRGVVYGLTTLYEEIQAEREVHRKRVEQGLYDRAHTDEMHRGLKEMENRVNRWIDSSSPLALEEVNNRADEIGKFRYTWRNFSDWVNPVAIILASLLGALLDMLSPVLSLVLFRQQDTSDYD